MDDPFDKLGHALTGALGATWRTQLQEMINALLDQEGQPGLAST
ncbi:hypothetical protein [Nonomuraea sp. B19D2]